MSGSGEDREKQGRVPFPHCLVISIPSTPGRHEVLIDLFPPLSEITGQRAERHTELACCAPAGITLVASAGTHCTPLTTPLAVW